MGLVTRQIGPDDKGSKLTFAEMDNNLYYLQGLGVSGLTYSANTLTITNPTGGTNTVSIVTNTAFTGGTVTGSTTFTNGLISNTISATTISGDTLYGDGSNLTGISTQDTVVTGGTYSDGTAVFTNSTGGTFYVTGFYTGVTGSTDVYVTGGTFSSSTITFTNNTGGTFNVTGLTIGTTLSKTLFVDPSGNDSTAVKGNINKPYANLYAAKSAATSGDTIYVFPGTWTYDNRASAGYPYNGQMDTLVNLWKDGVSYYFNPNSKIIFYNQTVSGENMYLFKPLGSGTTCTVRGSLDFSGSSIGADSSNGAVQFFVGNSDDGGFTFDCEVKTVITKSNPIGLRGGTTGGTNAVVIISADEISYTHLADNVGQSQSGIAVDLRTTPPTDYYIKARKITSTGYGLIGIRGIPLSSKVFVDVDEAINTSDASGFYVIQAVNNSSPNVVINIKKLGYKNGLLATTTNQSTFIMDINSNIYETGSSVRTSPVGFETGTINLRGTVNVNYNNRQLFYNSGTGNLNIFSDINFTLSNFTNYLFSNISTGQINYQGNIYGNFQGIIGRSRNGKITVKNSTIYSSLTGGTIFSNDVTNSTGSTVFTNSTAVLNTSSNMFSGQYLKNYVFNSQIKNSGSADVFVNTTSAGSLQVHNTSLVSTSGSTITISGSAPLTISNSVSNTNISATTTNGTVTVLTQLDLI